MKTKEIDIIKLGGSIITDKQKYRTLRDNNLEKITEVLSHWNKPFILVHGAGSFGHIKAEEYSINEGFIDNKQLHGVTTIRSDMTELTEIIVSALKRNGINAIGFQTSSIVYQSFNGQISSFLDPIQKALSIGLCPVLSGDILFSERFGFKIYSGDSLIENLSKTFLVDNVVFVTDVDGLFTKDKTTGEIILIEKISSSELNNLEFYEIQKEKSIDVTGSMKGKIDAILSISANANNVIIVNGQNPKRIIKVLNGSPSKYTLIT